MVYFISDEEEINSYCNYLCMHPLTANGPAVGFSKRYPTTAPPQICPGRPDNCHGARRVWRTFCSPGTNFNEHYECRDTKLIGATNLSPDTNLLAGTGAVSRYNADRSQKTVKVYWILIASRCAYPGARTIINLSCVQEQKQKV